MTATAKLAAFLIALAISVPLAIADAAAAVVVREKTSYYKVSGLTGSAIYDQIEKKGPRIKGRKEHLVATASFDFNFDTKKFKASMSGGQCRIVDAVIVLTVTYRMPQWVDDKRASPAVRRAWKQFVDFVWQHEKRHMEIARDAAHQMLRAVKSARGDARRECAGIEDGIEDKIAAILERHNRRQKEFDASPWGIGGQVFTYDNRLMAAK